MAWRQRRLWGAVFHFSSKQLQVPGRRHHGASRLRDQVPTRESRPQGGKEDRPPALEPRISGETERGFEVKRRGKNRWLL